MIIFLEMFFTYGSIYWRETFQIWILSQTVMCSRKDHTWAEAAHQACESLRNCDWLIFDLFSPIARLLFHFARSFSHLQKMCHTHMYNQEMFVTAR